MRILSKTEYQQEAQPILRRVFNENKLYEQPFSSLITEKVIIFPCEDLADSLLVNGLCTGAIQVSDIGCYLTQLWHAEHQLNNCYISIPELQASYGDSITINKSSNVDLNLSRVDIELYMDIIPDHLLYSATGKWGLMTSHERFGLLGGSHEFMEAVRRYVPDLDEQVYRLLEDYQLSKTTGMHLTLEWLPVLLTHLYGQEIAEKVLKETGLS